MEKHFVEFFSPGTFVSESTVKEIESWDVKKAVEMSRGIKERHGATPYGFRFITRTRNEDELDSKVTNRSNMYFLGGEVLYLADIEERNDPKDSTLIWNMKINKIDRVIENKNSWKVVFPLEKDDVVLEY